MAILLDVMIIALGILAFSYGKRRGFIAMVWGAVAWVLTAMLVAAMITPVTNALLHTQPIVQIKSDFADSIKDSIYEQSSGALSAMEILDDPKRLSEVTRIPQIIIPELNLSGTVENAVSGAADRIVDKVSYSVLRALVGMALFVLVRIMMGIAYRVLRSISKLPVIKGVNRLIGGLLGLVNYMFIMYAVLAVIALVLMSNATGAQGVIDQTYLVKYFYNNNVLLHLLNL